MEIYTDRIEVSSPGGLPKGLTLADLGHRSVRRNPLISDLLHRIGFIEKAGTGIRRIRDEARELDCPEPEFEAGTFVTVTFRPNPEVREEVTPEVRLLEAMSGDVTRQHLQLALGLSDGATADRRIVSLRPVASPRMTPNPVPERRPTPSRAQTVRKAPPVPTRRAQRPRSGQHPSLHDRKPPEKTDNVTQKMKSAAFMKYPG